MRDVLVRTLAEDYATPLAKLRCPVELVWGTTTRPLRSRWRGGCETELSDAHLVVCPGAGHLTPLTVPGELRAAIERLKT